MIDAVHIAIFRVQHELLCMFTLNSEQILFKGGYENEK